MHGPADAEKFLVWCLDHGFQGVVPARTPRPFHWAGLRSVLAELPVQVPAVRVGGLLEVADLPEAGICSSQEGEQAQSFKHIEDRVALAHHLGCPRVILEPGVAQISGEDGEVDLGDSDWSADAAKSQFARRQSVIDAALDRACRFFFRLCGAFPDTEFCLTGSRHVFGLGEPRSLAAIFEDLPSRKLRYWHDAPVAARRAELFGTEQGEWLENFANQFSGMTLGDTSAGRMYLPPGAGGVDYPLLGAYRLRSSGAMLAVIELDPGVDSGELPGVSAYLDKFGL